MISKVNGGVSRNISFRPKNHKFVLFRWVLNMAYAAAVLLFELFEERSTSYFHTNCHGLPAKAISSNQIPNYSSS